MGGWKSFSRLMSRTTKSKMSALSSNVLNFTSVRTMYSKVRLTYNTGTNGRSFSSSSVLTQISSIPKNHPLMFGACFTCMKTAGADIFVQTYVEKKEWEDVDWRRTATFAVFGFGYMGIAQYFLYVHLMARRWFPNAGAYAAKSLREKMKDRQGTRELFAQVAIDQIIHIPFIFYPAYYLTKSAIMEKPVGHEDDSVPGLAFYKWKKNFFGDLKTSWTIWIPANLINFGFMPMHFRISFMACVSFGFCVVLSLTRGGGEQKKLSSDAQKLQNEIVTAAESQKSVHDVVELVKEALRKAHLASDDKDDATAPELDFDQFVEIMGDVMGINDQSVLRSVFDACDRDRSGSISSTELSTLLLAFHRGDSSDENRVRMIFDCVDLDASGFITFDEAKVMIRGLLSMREVLLEHGGEANMMDSMDAIASASGSYQRNVAQQVKDPEKLKKIRLQDLKQRYTKFRNNRDVTMTEILDYEAGRLSRDLFYEADTEDADNKISRDEFLQWINTESASSKKFMHLFSAFTELFGEH